MADEPQELASLGFIGLGTMGSRMAANLQKAGHALTVNDIAETAAMPLLEAGATWAGTPKDVAEASDVVLMSLPGPKEVEAVTLGPGGILEGLRPGTVVVDLSTNSPAVVRDVAARIEAAGGRMVDAPVSGGPMGADAGTLAVMAGGDEVAFERVRPLLEAIGGSVTHIGGIGTGSVAKLVHNAISMTTRIVVQDGMALATKAGVRPAKMLEVLREASFGQQLILKRHIPDLVFTGDFDHPRFNLALSHKDVSLALELAHDMDAPMPHAEMADRTILEGIERGWGARDNLVTFLLAEERAGVEVRDDVGE